MTSSIFSFPWYLLNKYHFPEYILTGKIPAGKMDLQHQSLQPCKASMSRAVLCPFLGDSDFWEGSLTAYTYCKALIYYLACSRIPNRSVDPVDCQVKDLIMPFKEFAAPRLAAESLLLLSTLHGDLPQLTQRGEVWTRGEENQTSDNIRGEGQTKQM